MKNAFIFISGFFLCSLIFLIFLGNLSLVGIKAALTSINFIYDSGKITTSQNKIIEESVEEKEHKILWAHVTNRDPNYIEIIKELIYRHVGDTNHRNLNSDEWYEIHSIAAELLQSPDSTEVEHAAWILRYSFDYQSTFDLLKLAVKKKKFRNLVVKTLTYNERHTCRITYLLSGLVNDEEVKLAEKKIAKEALERLKNECSWVLAVYKRTP